MDMRIGAHPQVVNKHGRLCKPSCSKDLGSKLQEMTRGATNHEATWGIATMEQIECGEERPHLSYLLVGMQHLGLHVRASRLDMETDDAPL